MRTAVRRRLRDGLPAGGNGICRHARGAETICGVAYGLDADEGHYVDYTAASIQRPCEIGTYQPATGQASCKSCPTN